MVIYADTSFLVSLYGSDGNSLRANQAAQSLSRPFPWTELVRLECRNAFHLSQFRGELNPKQCGQLLDCLDEDRAAGILHPIALDWGAVYTLAEDIASSTTPTMGNRSLDILHVASAKWLKATVFLTFDLRQSPLARHVGMDVPDL